MDIELLKRVLDDQQAADAELAAWGVHDTRRARENLRLIGAFGVPPDLLANLAGQLAAHLPKCSDADMALNNLETFIGHARSPMSLAALFERDPTALPELLTIFSTSQYLADILINDTESYDLLRLTEGRPIARDVLVEELCAEVASLGDRRDVMRTLRRFKRREMLRISYCDLILDQHMSVITEQISFVAEAMLEAAFRSAAARQLKHDKPGSPAPIPPMVIIALGKLGGRELNYSSDIDVIFFHDATEAANRTPEIPFDQLQRIAQETTRLLTETTELGQAYRVDLRLRPDGGQSAILHSTADALRYYDLKGRTWERQAFIKARAVAGDVPLGRRFLNELQPWIYRKFLTAPDIEGIKALKRRIERRSRTEGASQRDVKAGHGGLRDVEFTVQFLQLLNGGEQPAVRTENTLDAIHRLADAGCLNQQERHLLERNYRFLRKIEHRLQILFDLQTHELPESESELRKLAIRLGFSGDSALRDFQDALDRATSLNRRILDHLLHDAFGQDEGVAAETDLVLDPEPEDEAISAVLSPYGFQDVPAAYKNLMSLAEEQIRFLSTRRCRHFLASLAPALLTAIGKTPDPDATLTSLDRVTSSLGGKAVLWELFSANPATMRLCVELCSISSFLSGILIRHPGMLDELVDSLMQDTLPTREEMDAALAELCRGAEDLAPILHSFRNSYLLRIGARDILGFEDLSSTTAALTDLAECLLSVIAMSEYEAVCERYGEPRLAGEPSECTACRCAVVALGKFGGRELTYHSDLDLVFLYEGEGQTAGGSRGEPTSNAHFFGEWASKITKAISHLGPWGRLYEVDARLRPTGRSGALATSLPEFQRYFESEQGQLWERQAMCKARPAHASPDFDQDVQHAIWHAAFGKPLEENDLAAVRQMRKRLEDTAKFGNIKRGPGGIVDHEFLAQMLRLRHVSLDDKSQHPDLRSTSTMTTLQAMHEEGILPADDWGTLQESYLFLRRVQLRHRLMSSITRDELPSDPAELRKLAHSMGLGNDQEFVSQCHDHLRNTREVFEKHMRI